MSPSQPGQAGLPYFLPGVGTNQCPETVGSQNNIILLVDRRRRGVEHGSGSSTSGGPTRHQPASAMQKCERAKPRSPRLNALDWTGVAGAAAIGTFCGNEKWWQASSFGDKIGAG